MSRQSSSKQTQGGHIVIQNQSEDDGVQSGLIVISNTTPMEEIDGIQSIKPLSSTRNDAEKKRTTSRVASDVEKSVRIRSNRVPSAKSITSGKIPLSPSSILPGTKIGSTTTPEVITKSPTESDRHEEKEHQVVEETKLHDYESVLQGRLDIYRNDEENFICYRFPHLKFCACKVDYFEIKNTQPVEVFPGIFISTLHQSLVSKNLLRLGITQIINLAAVEFTKRPHYFEYLTLDIFDTHDEDIKKHFRITNRFISDSLQNGGKILVHSFDSKSRAPAFILAFMIGKKKRTLKSSLDYMKELWPNMEINPYFYKQLEQYDLEKLAIGSSIKV